MSWRRVLLGAVWVGLSIAVAVVGGVPDLGRSIDLVTGNVSSATESAFIVLLCWLGVVLLGVAGVLSLMPVSLGPSQRTRARSLAVLALGLTLLGMGIVRQETGYRVCCSDPNTAQQAEHLVH